MADSYMEYLRQLAQGQQGAQAVDPAQAFRQAQGYLMANEYSPVHDAMGRQMGYQERLNNLVRSNAGMAGGGGMSPENLARLSMLELTQGMADQVMADPYYQQALDFYGGMASGENVPFTPDVINRVYGQAADMNAAAQGSQLEQLARAAAASGGSIYDPSYGAAERAATANRQLQNQGAARDISTQAQLANYDATVQGAQGLVGTRGQQYGQALPGYSQAAGLIGQMPTSTSYGASPQAPRYGRRTPVSQVRQQRMQPTIAQQAGMGWGSHPYAGSAGQQQQPSSVSRAPQQQQNWDVGGYQQQLASQYGTQPGPRTVPASEVTNDHLDLVRYLQNNTQQQGGR